VVIIPNYDPNKEGQIDGVKEIWALENKGTAGTVIPESEKNTISVF